MSVQPPGSLKSFVSLVTLMLALVLAGCGGGGGGAPAPLPAETSLPLMFDSLGRQVPEAEFGGGDPGAAGVDGTVFDLGPLANAAVTLTDAGGTGRGALTDASGYYRVNIKGLKPPFIANVRRGDGTRWFSASVASVLPRGFVTINLSALTDKTLGYVAEAANIPTGAASAVTTTLLTANPGALMAARQRISSSLAGPLARAGLDARGYDPVATPLSAAVPDKHAAFLQSLKFITSGNGRTVVGWTAAGGEAAPFSFPSGVAVDAAGNVLVSDTGNHVVRRISPAGVVTTLAGTGQPGFADGPLGTAAFAFPGSVAADVQGNVYVADGHGLRKIAANGVVTTLVANHADKLPPSLVVAIAVDAAGSVYFVDDTALRKLTPDGVVRTIATVRSTDRNSCCSLRPAGDIVNPRAMAVDAAGNIYVAGPVAVVKITPAGAKSDLYLPKFEVEGLAADAGGTVYATMANGVWKITSDGAASLLAGGTFGRADGAGSAAQFISPLGIALDARGDLFVADQSANTIRKVAASGEVTTFAGARPGFADGAGGTLAGGGFGAKAGWMRGVAASPDGTILVSDSGNHAIRKISPDGTVTTVAGNGSAGFSNGNRRAASFNTPEGIAVDGEGNIYVSDSGNHVIRKITASGDVTTFAGNGVEGHTDGQGSVATFTRPLSLAVGPGGDVYVADDGILRKITAAGVVSTIAPPRLGNQMELLFFVVAKIGGPVYVTVLTSVSGDFSGFTRAIFSVSPEGVFSPVTGTLAAGNEGVAVDGSDNLYYVQSNGILARVRPSGVQTDLLSLNTFYTSDVFFENIPMTAYGDGLLVIADRKNAAVLVVML